MESEEIHCDLCNIDCKNDQAFQAHCFGIMHTQRAYLSKPEEESNSVSQWASPQDIPEKAPTVAVLPPQSGIDPNFYCATCNITCSGPQTFKDHVVGKPHQKRALHGPYTSAQEAGIKSEFYCEVCEITCSTAHTFKEHIIGKPHLMRFKRSTMKMPAQGQAGMQGNPSIGPPRQDQCFYPPAAAHANKTNTTSANVATKVTRWSEKKHIEDAAKKWDKGYHANFVPPLQRDQSRLTSVGPSQSHQTSFAPSQWEQQFDPAAAAHANNTTSDDGGPQKPVNYSCATCNITCTGPQNFKDHVTGKQHRKRALQANEDGSGVQTKKMEKGKPYTIGVLYVQSVLDSCKDPLIGLQHVCEFQDERTSEAEPKYVCNLCESQCDPRTLLSHVTGFKHRLRYLKEHYMHYYTTLSQMQGKRSETQLLVDDYAATIEAEEGRQCVRIKFIESNSPVFTVKKRKVDTEWKPVTSTYSTDGLGKPTMSLMQALTEVVICIKHTAVSSEAEASVALQASTAITQSLMDYRLNKPAANWKSRNTPGSWHEPPRDDVGPPYDDVGPPQQQTNNNFRQEPPPHQTLDNYHTQMGRTQSSDYEISLGDPFAKKKGGDPFATNLGTMATAGHSYYYPQLSTHEYTGGYA